MAPRVSLVTVADGPDAVAVRAVPEPLVHRNEYALIGEPLSAGGDTDTSAPDGLTDTDGAPGADVTAGVIATNGALGGDQGPAPTPFTARATQV